MSRLTDGRVCVPLVPSYLKPNLPSGLLHPYQMDESISSFRGVWFTVSFLFYF